MGSGLPQAQQQLTFAWEHTDTAPGPEARQRLSDFFRDRGHTREDVKFFQAFIAPLGYAAGELRNIAGFHARTATAAKSAKDKAERAALDAEEEFQCALIRDIFGNPFCPATLDPVWLTPTVTALAAQMYESRDFSLMPVLADALQDAGCDNENILNHCRASQLHVRGCWAVDLILGKE